MHVKQYTSSMMYRISINCEVMKLRKNLAFWLNDDFELLGGGEWHE